MGSKSKQGIVFSMIYRELSLMKDIWKSGQPLSWSWRIKQTYWRLHSIPWSFNPSILITNVYFKISRYFHPHFESNPSWFVFPEELVDWISKSSVVSWMTLWAACKCLCCLWWTEKEILTLRRRKASTFIEFEFIHSAYIFAHLNTLHYLYKYS